MRLLNTRSLAILTVLLAAGSARAQDTSPTNDGWTTYLYLRQLNGGFAAHPEAATMSDPTPGWGSWPAAPDLPAELRHRVFVNVSYVLLDVDPQGNLTSGVGLKGRTTPAGSVYQALTGDATTADPFILETAIPGLSLIRRIAT